MLHVSIPTLSPSQGRPPEAGGGLVPERYRLRTPTSQVRLHALHRVQLLQPQSTEKHTHKIEDGDVEKWKWKIHHIRYRYTPVQDVTDHKILERRCLRLVVFIYYICCYYDLNFDLFIACCLVDFVLCTLSIAGYMLFVKVFVSINLFCSF